VVEHPDVAAQLKQETLAWDQSLPPLNSYDYLVPKFERHCRLTFRDTFEDTPVNARPRRATVYMENKGDSIVICEAPGRDGERCVKITDAPGLEHTCHPHFVYMPSHYSGVTTVSFDLRLGPGATMYHQWRQYPGKPYYFRGPTFYVRDGKLYHNLRKDALMRLPESQWIRVGVTSGNGSDAGSEWKLLVTCPGEVTRTFRLPIESADDYRETTWIGFVSGGHSDAEYWIDNLELKNSKADASE
jgi:hypothetical protein